jgi:hypothetical protein
LWRLIDEVRAATVTSGFVVSNAVTLLTDAKESFDGRDLSSVWLPQAEFPHSMRKVNFHNASLEGSILRSKDLRESNLLDARFDPAGLVAADLRGANGVGLQQLPAITNSIPESKSQPSPEAMAELRRFLDGPHRVCALAGANDPRYSVVAQLKAHATAEGLTPVFFTFSWLDKFKVPAAQLATLATVLGTDPRKVEDPPLEALWLKQEKNFAEQLLWIPIALDVDRLLVILNAGFFIPKEMVSLLANHAFARAKLILSSTQVPAPIPAETPIVRVKSRS